MRNKSPQTAPELRAHNRSRILRILRDHGTMSRTELARRSELSATTITKVVAGLIDEGCVLERERGTAEPRVGRPAIDIGLVQGAKLVCGVQVRGGAVQVGLCDLRAGVIVSRGLAFAADEAPERVMDRTARLADELITRFAADRSRVIGAGVAVPGPVDAAQRRNVLSINLGWRDVPFADHLESALRLPVVVDHNVRAMALAEARYGLGAEAGSLLYVYVRTGVGAGLIMRGEPFRPGTHGVTELGHLRVIEKGRRCRCGSNGCLETVASEPYLTEQIGSAIAAAPQSPLAVASHEHNGLLEALVMAAAEGDQAAEGILGDLVDHLTTGLASAVNLLNPELIVMGGVFAGAPTASLDRLRSALHAKTFPMIRDSVRIESSGLGIDAGVVGAAAVALDRFFYSPVA